MTGVIFLSHQINKGSLIVLEGLSNAGKTTLCRSVSTGLEETGIEVEAYYELTSPPGKILDGFFRAKQPMSPLLKAFLFSIDRRFLCENGINEQLQKGNNVIIDRYYHTNLVYRSLEGLDRNWLLNLEINNPMPDLTIYIDISPQESLSRAKNINKPTPYSLEFLSSARKKYLEFVETGHMRRINGMLTFSAVRNQLLNICQEFLS